MLLSNFITTIRAAIVGRTKKGITDVVGVAGTGSVHTELVRTHTRRTCGGNRYMGFRPLSTMELSSGKDTAEEFDTRRGLAVFGVPKYPPPCCIIVLLVWTGTGVPDCDTTGITTKGYGQARFLLAIFRRVCSAWLRMTVTLSLLARLE
jgi:hypothetical protein